MTTFDQTTIAYVVRAARKDNIDPVALMAVVEVESSGEPFESDKKTPRFLFERHVFYKKLKKLGQEPLDKALVAGLAHKEWRSKKKYGANNQYRDQQNSIGRLKLLAQARAIDGEAANRSCSWGVGQTMGFNAERLGFTSANAMVAAMMAKGVPGQIDCMIGEIRASKLIDELNRRDWAGFARVYNGPGYRDNDYDSKMAAAFRRWATKLDAIAISAPEPEVEAESEEDLPPSRVAEPPKGVLASKTVAAGGTIGTVAAGTLVEQALDSADKVVAVKDAAETLGVLDWIMQTLGHLMMKPSFWLFLIVIALAVFIIYDRRKKLLEHFV